MRKTVRYIQAIILLPMILFAGDVAAQMLRPARAVYDLKLDQSRQSPGVNAAKGRLVVELIESCDGFIFNQGFITNFTSSDGQGLTANMQASVWESTDRRSVRFNLVNRNSGNTVKKEQGRGDLTADGSGKGVWHLPKARELALPKGTMFPISHNRAVLKHALSGGRGFEVALFDGSYEAGYYQASVFIGNPSQGQKGQGNKLLAKDLTSWPIRLAYYHYDDGLGVPQFEVGFTLYSDGVVDDLILDYSEFGLTGRLVELEYIDKIVCK
jgi:hypothetical protein|tara:strand:+ start:75 stop:881 length:807 start_codon:yes stop_codon:yes gene_type:complete